jgi:hypothetical protein
MPAFSDAYLIPEFIVNPVPQSGASEKPNRAKTAETVLNILEGRIGVRRLAITTLMLVIKLRPASLIVASFGCFSETAAKRFRDRFPRAQ